MNWLAELWQAWNEPQFSFIVLLGVLAAGMVMGMAGEDARANLYKPKKPTSRPTGPAPRPL